MPSFGLYGTSAACKLSLIKNEIGKILPLDGAAHYSKD